jgi:RimJ/RimL family protein N-acetyltransferase
MEIIKTKKFILRPYRMSDAKVVTPLLNNWNVAKNLSSLPFPYELEHAHEFIKKTNGEMKKKDTENFVCVIEIDGKASGAIDIHHIKHGHKAEMGYWLAENHWGEGIMTEVVKKFMQLVFVKFKLRRICAKAYESNKGSMRVMEKAGMEFEGIEKKGALKDGKYIDLYVYAKMK